jgi:hypothetical protein
MDPFFRMSCHGAHASTLASLLYCAQGFFVSERLQPPRHQRGFGAARAGSVQEFCLKLQRSKCLPMSHRGKRLLSHSDRWSDS